MRSSAPCRRARLNRALGALAGLAAGLTLLAGCGAAAGEVPAERPTKYTAAERAGHNQTDVDFAQMMLVHTRRSTQLVELAQERTQRPEVLALAEGLAASDAETMASMTTLLEGWDEVVPDDIALTEMDHSQMDHEGIGMGFNAGITDAQLTFLDSSTDDKFDKRFLDFILTHRGAGVAMATAERMYGQSGAATKIAKESETEQAAEMDAIQGLIEELRDAS